MSQPEMRSASAIQSEGPSGLSGDAELVYAIICIGGTDAQEFIISASSTRCFDCEKTLLMFR